MSAANTEFALMFRDAHARAMNELQEWFVQRCYEEFNQDDWEYLTEPKIRDIVNTGKLRDSLVLTPTADGGFEATWTADYAFDVHEGGTTLDGEKFLGRPWTRDIIAELPAQYAEFLDLALKAYA